MWLKAKMEAAGANTALDAVRRERQRRGPRALPGSGDRGEAPAAM
jgi:hypothetical protein